MRRIVEDAPRGNSAPLQLPQPARERVKVSGFVRRVVSPRRPMESKVDQSGPSARLPITLRSWRIGSDARNLELVQHAIGAALEPAGVPRLERDTAIVPPSQDMKE